MNKRGERWMHKVQYGPVERVSYSKIENVLEIPDLKAVQTESFEWFVKEGMKEAFDSISPIEDYAGSLVLEFVDYYFEDLPKYTVEEARDRDVSYSKPLKVRIRLINKDTGELKEQEVFMGDFPMMTEGGSFIINGAERVIVSQLVRSPGAYYSRVFNNQGEENFEATIIPNRGAWLEYDVDAQGVVNVRVDRTRKLPLTTLIRALLFETDEEILEVLGESPHLRRTLEKDITSNQEEAMIELYKKMRPGDPASLESAETLIKNLFFDDKRYDMAKVGRYKFNKKLALRERITGELAAKDIIDLNTGEILVSEGEIIELEEAIAIENAGLNMVDVMKDEGPVRVVGNHFVDYESFNLPYDRRELGLAEKVYYPAMIEVLENTEEDELERELRNNRDLLSPMNITQSDMLATISYEFNLFQGVGSVVDIDHLGNRRVRSVGELLQNQFRIGLTRMERVVRERMSTQDPDLATPQALINIRPVVAAMKEFFGSSQLSQFMEQVNPLAELTNKRRLSALGPGGLSRERAGVEVRDVHASHYGRICPIETPEGPNIGLITSITTYGRINEYGFLETAYRKVDKETGQVTHEIVYLTADLEDQYIIAQANEPLDEENHFVNERVSGRGINAEYDLYAREDVDYMDISPQQIVSVGTALIPFLENDDATRALMGANMQRQAVPLLQPDSPIIGTGIESKAARDSGAVIIARNSGRVSKVQANLIEVTTDEGKKDIYRVMKFRKANQETAVNQRPIVKLGDTVEKGDVIADGPSTELGELALGRNILVAIMNWEGYNFEDAILLNEDLAINDALTSIHIEEYESEARETKLGPEEITRDIPNISESALKNLDEGGVVLVGSEVSSGDILVGKVTPKGETEPSPEERLLRAIFGEKAREVRDTSLRVPHGESGMVLDVKSYSRENNDELTPGVNEVVRVYIATKRKIMVGDKMCGRHGNKGVISKLLPREDMPFLPNGKPVEMLLNPLGIPSRMNLGQILEVHLGLAASELGWKVATPVFDGASEHEIMDALEMAGYPRSGKIELRDGRTGEKFDEPVTFGYMYLLKLHHMVVEKIHARSTGPYSLVTQQPLGGKAQFGGQRFGEMEVWALEAYGAAHTLQEILTVKSDDIVGRVKTYEAIVKDENIPEPGLPESFKVLVKELQSLALDIKLLDQEGTEIFLQENSEENTDFNKIED